MEISDLETLDGATNPILVFPPSRRAVWMNRRARRMFPDHKAADLLDALQRAPGLAPAVEAATAQDGAFPARIASGGATHRGTLRRLRQGRLLFEITPARADAFRALTQARRAEHAALAEERRAAERLRRANERLRMTTQDILSVAAVPLDELARLLDRLRALDESGKLGLRDDLRDAARRLQDSRAQIAGLQALADDSFLIDLSEVVRLPGLVARLRSEGDAGRRARLEKVRLRPLPALQGNVLLARRLLNRLLTGMAGDGPSEPPAIEIDGRTDGAAALVRLSAALGPEAPAAADRLARCEYTGHLARQLGWRLALRQEGETVTVELRGPRAPDDAPVAPRSPAPAPAPRSADAA